MYRNYEQERGNVLELGIYHVDEIYNNRLSQSYT